MPFAAVKGAIDALGGGDFVDGAGDVFGAALEVGAEFGDTNGGESVSRVLTGLLLGIGFDLPTHFGDPD